MDGPQVCRSRTEEPRNTANKMRAHGVCFDCGGEVRVSDTKATDGVCLNCGPVGIDLKQEGGTLVEGFSVQSWLDFEKDRAETAANPLVFDDDDVPF
jgi:hypothetical protein